MRAFYEPGPGATDVPLHAQRVLNRPEPFDELVESAIDVARTHPGAPKPCRKTWPGSASAAGVAWRHWPAAAGPQADGRAHQAAGGAVRSLARLEMARVAPAALAAQLAAHARPACMQTQTQTQTQKQPQTQGLRCAAEPPGQADAVSAAVQRRTSPCATVSLAFR